MEGGGGGRLVVRELGDRDEVVGGKRPVEVHKLAPEARELGRSRVRPLRRVGVVADPCSVQEMSETNLATARLSTVGRVGLASGLARLGRPEGEPRVDASRQVPVCAGQSPASRAQRHVDGLRHDVRQVVFNRRNRLVVGIESVRVFAESRLLAVLGDSGSTLRLGGLPFARHLSVELDRPERWIDFLEGRGVLAGTRRFGTRRR